MFKLKNTILDADDLNKIQGSLGVPQAPQNVVPPPTNTSTPMPMTMGTPTAPTTTMPVQQPQPKVGWWDVMKEVPGAALTVGKEIAGGIIKPFAKAASTLRAINYGTRGLASYGVRRLFGDEQGAQEALNKNMAEANKGINLPLVGNVQPLSPGPRGMGEALLTGVEIGTMVIPEAVMQRTLGRIALTRGGIKVLPKLMSPIEKQIVERAAGNVKAATEQMAKFNEVKQRVMLAIEKAKNVFGQQEELRSAELAKRVTMGEQMAMGKTGTQAELARRAALKGKMPDIQFESILKDVGPEDFEFINSLIQDSPMLSPLEKVNASEGWRAIFGETGGAIPGNYDLEQLAKVIGEDFVKKLLDKRPMIMKIRDAFITIAGEAKTNASVGDFSASFRQLLPFVGRKEFWKALPKQFRAAFDERYYAKLADDIAKDPDYAMLKDVAKVDFTDLGLFRREESFAGRGYSEKIPVWGPLVVKPSERAFTFLTNKVRWDVSKSLLESARMAGIKPESKTYLLREIGRFVNDGTGRGTNMFGGERGARAVNVFLWSPRLMSSRLRILSQVFTKPVQTAFDVLKPGKYVAENAFMRKQALKTALGFAGFLTTALGMAKAAGADIELNPLSSDFGKARFGNTRYDLLGGFGQYIVYFSRFIMNQSVSPTSGATSYFGEGYKPDNRLNLTMRFVQSKASPIAGLVLSLMTGKDFEGNKINVPQEVLKKFVPLVYQDMWDLTREQGFLRGIGMSIPSIFGIGVQTFENLSEPEAIKLQWKNERQHFREQQKKQFDVFK